jgi:hypothetical protein
MTVRYVLQAPETDSPKEKLTYACELCGARLFSNKLETHALYKHGAKSISTDNRAAWKNGS